MLSVIEQALSEDKFGPLPDRDAVIKASMGPSWSVKKGPMGIVRELYESKELNQLPENLKGQCVTAFATMNGISIYGVDKGEWGGGLFVYSDGKKAPEQI